MPAIKLKKAAAEHQAEKEREERERESEVPTNVPAKPKESHPGASLLRGLDTNILFEKRKRTLPPSEQKLMDWIESHLEAKEDCHVNLNALYEYFGEACTFDGTGVVDQPVFNKRIVEKFGKAFALKESSPYKGLIKEKKAKDKGKVVKADTLKLKMKDIIEEAIKEAGNPEKGVRFFSLKQYIACNYPALRVDLRPGYLKVALERGVKYGHIQLVRGVGLSGYYRLPVDEEPDETEEKPDDEEAKKTSDEHVTEEQNGDAEATEDKPDDEAAAAKPKKKSRKRKSAEGEGGEEGEKAEGEEGEEGESKKKTKKKKPKRRRPRYSDNYHSSPQKIEDTFALAMTYMCEPKQTSFGKIRKYIAEHYPHVDIEYELKAKMESGERKGYWEHVTGQGLAGTFRLMIDEFDPNSTDNIEDMICSAIIACNEPKQASANLLKKYVMEYHPEFKIESRPHYFKNALERALKKQMIIQLSGIGASGSFQMWSVFSPSPALLAGENDSEEETIFTEKEEAYVPRGTKSRGLSVRKNPIERAAEYRSKPQKRSAPTNRSDTPSKKAASSKVRPRPKSAKSSSRSRAKVNYSEKEDGDVEEVQEEEADDEEEDEPAPKKARKASKASKAKKGKRPAKASPKKKGQKPVSRAQLAEAEEEEEEEEVNEEEETKPKKSKKSKAVVEEEEEEEVTPVKSSRGRSRSRPNYAEGKEDSDDDEPKSGKGRKSSVSRRGSKSVNYGEGEDEEEDEGQEKAEYTPRKSKSRGGDEEEAETSTSPKKKGKKRR